MKKEARLTRGPVGRTLLFMTIPLVFGFFAMIAFNLVDSIFVAQLGTEPLAALSFTFPVVMMIASIALGLGTGTGAVIAQAIGEGNRKKVTRLATDSLILSTFVVVVCAVAGILTIEPVFTLLGATPEILPLVGQYMKIWYIGVVFVIVPMVGNHAIRATGDTKYPSIIMATASFVNIILDPLMIFGLLFFPRLELSGAALATVIARATSLVLAFSILHFRERMIDFSLPRPREFIASVRRILSIGIPATVTNLLFPLSMGVVTWLASRFGPEGVASVGAGLRVESFAFIVIIALSAALMPFVGQNWGAQNFRRVHAAQKAANLFTFGWGFFCWGMFALFAYPIARLFSEEEIVIRYIMLYLFIMPAGLPLQGVFHLVSVVFNAIDHPLHSAGLNLIRMFIFYIPLAYFGTVIFAFPGLIGGIALANIISGIIAFYWIRRVCVHDEVCIRGESPDVTIP
jgi:putative MATE family efflux protein